MTECWFCGDERDLPVGGWLHSDARWRAGHPPNVYGPRGLVILESTRHVLDTTELNAEEAATFGPMLATLTSAIKEVTGAERVYTWSSMAHAAHLHVWLLPWWPDVPVKGPSYLKDVEAYACTPEEAEQTAERLAKVLGVR